MTKRGIRHLVEAAYRKTVFMNGWDMAANPLIPEDAYLIRQGHCLFSGSLVITDISGFTELTGRLGELGKPGIEELASILNRYFDSMYSLVKKHGGSVLSSAGDSILARFARPRDASLCAEAMMKGISSFRRIETEAGECELNIKTVVGSGRWNQFLIGDAGCAHIFLSGELVGRMASAESKAPVGSLTEVRSDEGASSADIEAVQVPDRAFYIPSVETLRDEHRSITALFINVTGYDFHDPPVGLLRGIYDTIAGITRRRRGIVQMVDNMLTGGFRIFLLFGAPLSYGNDLIRALQAGLDIRRQLLRSSGITITMGVDTGYAFSGVIGNHWRKQYTVIGDVVNTAARLADIAAPGSISVSEKACRMSRGEFTYSSPSSVMLRGKGDETKVFTPLSIRRDPIDRFSFVGREEELNTVLGRLRKGSSATLIQGVAGIGKTRFLKQITSRLSEAGRTVYRGTAPENGRTWDILASLVANMAGMMETDSAAVRKSRLWYLIHDLEDASGNLSRREPFIGRMLFSIEYPDSGYDSVPPRLKRENLLEGISLLIGALGGNSCIVLEDLHNCTDEDREAVDFIVDRVMKKSSSDTVFLLSRRPDERECLSGCGGDVMSIDLKELSSGSADELMHEILEGMPLDPSVEKVVRERSGGNPFYLMQFLFYLQEEELVALQKGIWKPTGRYSDDKLPANIFSMIMARIDRLGRDAKESLRIGSVIGVRFDEKTVSSVAGKGTRKSLCECSDAGLTVEQDPGLEYEFSHTLIRDVSYDSILRRRRRDIHRQIAGILEAGMSGNNPASADTLAHHYRIAHEWEKALGYSLLAGDNAYGEFRNSNAVQHYSNAMGIIEDHLPGNLKELPECLAKLARTYDRLGLYEKALDLYTRARDCLDDQGRRGEITLRMADIHFTMGEIDMSLDDLKKLEKRLREDGGNHDVLFMRIECFRAWSHSMRGELEVAMKEAQRGVEIAEGLSGIPEKEIRSQQGFAYNTIATVFWAKGDFATAGEYYQAALKIALRNGMKREIAITHGNLGLVYQKTGDYQKAVESFEKQMNASLEIGDKFMCMNAWGEISGVYNHTGRFLDGFEASETYLKLARELNVLHDSILARHQVALNRLVKGELKQSEELAGETIELARSSSLKREEALMLGLLGLINVERGNFSKAEELFLAARGLALEVSSKSLDADLLFNLCFMRLEREIPGDIDEAIQEMESLVTGMGSAEGRARLLVLRGELAFNRGDTLDGSGHYEAAIEIFRGRGLKPALGAAIFNFIGRLGQERTNEPEIRKLLSEALALQEEMKVDLQGRSRLLQMI